MNKDSTDNEFRLSDYHYELPSSLIAQTPLPNRSDSRLLSLNGSNIGHHSVTDLLDLLQSGDHLVFNNTRVIPARLFGQKKSGGKLELMLERFGSNGEVIAKVRASKSPKPGSQIELHSSVSRANGHAASDAEDVMTLDVVGRQDDLFILKAADASNDKLASFIEAHGEIPLPPYIERKPDQTDLERYQTVYADSPGAVAAPTAGLHFDENILSALAQKGITHSFITLHVGAGTFQPVRVEDPSKHVMHSERVSVDQTAVKQIKAAKDRGGRIIAIGTTSVRALEAAAADTGELQIFQGETRLFLTPGSTFNVVDGMFTNFHLPESTLLMLVAAFAGLEHTLAAYKEAVAEKYRFFSYGDAMLVWPIDGVRA